MGGKVAPSPVTTTGRYPWSVQVTGSGLATLNASGTDFVVAQDASPFGSGWTFAPVDQLVAIPQDANGPAGELRVYGTGAWRFFTALGGGQFQPPPADNGTLVQNPDGRTDQFNAQGQMTGRVSADGQETLSFSYTGTLLTGMTAIDGAATPSVMPDRRSCCPPLPRPGRGPTPSATAAPT